MTEENVSQKVNLKNIDETKKYLIEKINRDEWISKKHKKICTTLNYIKTFLILASTITGCVFIFAFDFLIGIPGIPIGITAGIKKYKLIIKKKEKETW